MYACLQALQDERAARLLQELRAMRELPVSQFKIGYAAAAMPVRHAIERREWAEATKIAPVEDSLPQVLAITYWARAIGFARDGKPDAAMPDVEKLNDLLAQVHAGKDDYWADQVEIQIEEAKAWVAQANGQHEDALSLLRSAAEKEDNLEKRPVTPGPIVPAREQLGDLLLQLNRAGEARKELEASLAIAPGRRGALDLLDKIPTNSASSTAASEQSPIDWGGGKK
jgi:tetratricopeptide (TPR) repeat protein